ncbi:uncharacterized protein SOCE26_050040 [Sorangium cellulosum]|uniref:Carrier domain-containing protein n=2 Tax=Sorangium cellulosum TaxID=56 RepID=A0A2L0EW82_SORCE|nr:uncharacterized protein SOCE26_050040 [Sorangium cellulosum]
MSRLREAFHVKLPLETLFSAPTLGALAERVDDAVRGAGAPLAASPAARPRPRSCVVPLVDGSEPGTIVLVPAVGGHLSAHMMRLAHAIGGRRPVVGLTTPAHAGLGGMPRTMAELCAQYAQGIMTQTSGGPLALVGYCFGGLSALELAVQLEDAGADVEQVIMLETEAPGSANPSPGPFDRAAALCRVARVWGLDVDAATLQGLSEEQAIQRVAASISTADLASTDVESTLRAILDSQEAHLGMLDSWTLRMPDVPVHLLRVSALREDAPQDYGWAAHRALASVQGLPGDHFGIVRPAYMETTSRALGELLTHPGGARPRAGAPTPG